MNDEEHSSSEGVARGRPLLEIRHLRLVEAVARTYGVTAAAPELHLSQSALSHQLRNLETDLGVRLFDRVGKRMVATPAGARLAASAARILGDLYRTEDELRSHSRDARYPFRVAASCATLYAWLGRQVGRFGAVHPELDVQIVFTERDREMDALLDGEIDLAVSARPPNDRRFGRRRLFALETVALVAAEHPLARSCVGGVVRWHELGGQTLFIHDLPTADEELLRASTGRGPTTRICRVQLTEAIVELARANQGVGLLSHWPDAPSIDLGSIVLLKVRPRHDREFSAVWRRNTSQDLPVEAFAAALSGGISTTSPSALAS